MIIRRGSECQGSNECIGVLMLKKSYKYKCNNSVSSEYKETDHYLELLFVSANDSVC